MPTTAVNLIDLTPTQLKRAASIKEQIDGLNKQLRGLLGAPATSRASPRRNRSMASGEGEVVGEIEGLLGGEEKIRQEVIPEISD